MNATIHTFLAGDGLELGGIFFEADNSKGCIVHIHGISGNVISSGLGRTYSELAPREGYSVLLLNSRGHDLCFSGQWFDRGTLKQIKTGFSGSTFEKIEECIYDISGAVDFLNEKGIFKIFISGHSTGANKAAICGGDRISKKLSGLIFLAPGDDVYLAKKELGEKFFDLSEEAERLVSEGMEEHILGNVNFGFPISAGSFQSLFRKNSPMDAFPYHDGKKSTILSKIRIPSLLVIPGNDEFVHITSEKAISWFKKNLNKDFSYRLISGADHRFCDKKEAAILAAISWMDSLP